MVLGQHLSLLCSIKRTLFVLYHSLVETAHQGWLAHANMHPLRRSINAVVQATTAPPRKNNVQQRHPWYHLSPHHLRYLFWPRLLAEYTSCMTAIVAILGHAGMHDDARKTTPSCNDALAVCKQV